ncbi:MAG: NUDIX hydrolase [uncultured bacterium]|nr:MAG: NUDIX hydrolase [uncultured bacterium]
MKRLALIKMLESYHPTDPQEIEFKQAILRFVETHPDCFERSLEIGHITASSFLLHKDHSKALLMHHAKLNQWLQLGGHCDGNPHVLDVAIKEAQEESGIVHISPVHTSIFDIDVHLIPANKKEKEHFHYDIRFLLHVTSDETIIKNSESKELRWIEKNLIALPTQSESVVRMFKKWIQH